MSAAGVGPVVPDPSRPVGVIGGVGPAATVCFLDKVLRLTVAERDQDNLDLVVLQHSTIPDRTAFILGESTEDPGPVMARDARTLSGLGVAFVVVPCNTAHYFTDEVEAASTVPVLSIVGETLDAVVARGDVEAIGLMATSGTLAAGVYQRAAAERGLRVLEPTPEEQAVVMHVIYDQVKASKPGDPALVGQVADALLARGAQLVVLGCTELSVVADEHDLVSDPRFVDSLDVLARRTVELSGHRLVG